MSEGNGAYVIDASPTKEFFISILVRDISLIDAVKDLIDNSVDGARKIRSGARLDGLSVQIALSNDHFVIIDNCGGIPVEVAREYAFRFGRPPNVEAAPGSIGKFGVGMKRALFKIGNCIEVTSVSKNSRFSLRWDVEEWKRLVDGDGKDIWELNFSQVSEGEDNPPEHCGTTLQVTELHPGISSEFGTTHFVNRLMEEIESAHELSMDSGLEIEVNDVEIRHKLAALFASNTLSPINLTATFPVDAEAGPTDKDVRLTIFAGVADSSFADSGWYVICNGRQVLKADKSKTTGWESATDGIKNPRAHQQFSRFRGYAFFDGSDASHLPWNTAKSGIDTESPVYQWAKPRMAQAMRQVIDFLNALDAELDTESNFLQHLVDNARPIRLSAIRPSEDFIYPEQAAAEQKPKLGRVSFQREVTDIEFLKSFFGVTSATLTGQRSYDYVLERERDE
jgi:hypothetical protein